MFLMLLEVLNISIHQRLVVFYHKQVLCILLFSRIGKIETSGNQDAPVYDDDLDVQLRVLSRCM